ncbi:histidine phosphatase family protein [Sporichthya brevicatena]|uniref:Histidine phosphatase family protein n=1 Tax=Sporichthya brevicatena TaxID=171442 RepID=A0ABN1GX51_9ACTN
MSTHTIVHLVRHGEVHNPEGVLYGRLPDFHLSELGRKMAERVAESFAGKDIAAVVSSPLERAQETAAPVAAAFDLPIHIDERLIETANYFEGKTFGVGDGSLRRPTHWPKLWNPFRPSWGEPYVKVAQRMLDAAAAARDLAPGHEIVCVSHQLPIWIARQRIEGNRLWHDPRKRQCGLASVTSIRYEGEKIRGLSYSEPAADLVPIKPGKGFSAGA